MASDIEQDVTAEGVLDDTALKKVADAIEDAGRRDVTIAGGYYKNIDGTATDCWNRPLNDVGALLSETPLVRDNLP